MTWTLVQQEVHTLGMGTGNTTNKQGCTYTGIGIGIGAYTRGIGKV